MLYEVITSQAVVTVDGTFDAGGPGERLLRTQEYGADAQQVMGDLRITSYNVCYTKLLR